MRKILCLILVMSLSLTMTACGSSSLQDTNDADATVEGVVRETAYAQGKYVQELLDIEYNSSRYDIYNGTMYISDVDYDEASDQYYCYINSIYPETERIYAVPTFDDNDDYSAWGINTMAACEDGIWMMQSKSKIYADAIYNIVMTSYDGEELARFYLGAIDYNTESFYSLTLDADGNLYTLYTNTTDPNDISYAVWIMSPSGELTVKDGYNIYMNFVRSSDGQVWGFSNYLLSGTDRDCLYLLSPDCNSLDEVEILELPDCSTYGAGNIYAVLDGFNGAVATISTDKGLYSLYADGTVEPFILFAENQIPKCRIWSISPFGDGSYFCTGYLSTDIYFTLTPRRTRGKRNHRPRCAWRYKLCRLCE